LLQTNPAFFAMSDGDDDEDSVEKRVEEGLDGSKRRKPPSESEDSSEEDAQEVIDRNRQLLHNSQLKKNFPEITQFRTLPGLTQFNQFSQIVPSPNLPGTSHPFPSPLQYRVAGIPAIRPAELERAIAVARSQEEIQQGIIHQVGDTGKKKRASKKQKKDGSTAEEKQKRKVVPLPPELAAFYYSPETRDRLKLVEELDPQSQQTLGVAYSITTGSDKPGKKPKKEWVLNDLRTEQLRELSRLLGCKNLGSVSKYLIRKEIGRKWSMGPVYDNFNIPNPVSDAKQRKLNTLFRIINCCFLPDNIKGLIAINESKQRTDFENANGKSPHAEFWRHMSDTVNDAAFNDNLSIILGVAEDTYLEEIVAGVLNLNDYVTGTYKTVSQNMRDLLRARGTIAKKKKLSGHHSNDTRDYLHKANLKVRKDVYMPGEAVYYLDYRCKEHPAIDQAFTESLNENHKADSDNLPIDIDDDDGDGKGKAKSKESKDYLKMLESANESLANVQLNAKLRQDNFMSFQKQQNEENTTRANWDAYINSCKTLLELRRTADTDDAVSDHVTTNLAKRIRALEVALSIPEEESAVREVL
jgi:hypothetical protein